MYVCPLFFFLWNTHLTLLVIYQLDCLYWFMEIFYIFWRFILRVANNFSQFLTYHFLSLWCLLRNFNKLNLNIIDLILRIILFIAYIFQRYLYKTEKSKLFHLLIFNKFCNSTFTFNFLIQQKLALMCDVKCSI